MKITKDTLINDAIKSNFMSMFVFKKYGMECFACEGKHKETLEYGAQVHNVDIHLLLEDLNKINAQ